MPANSAAVVPRFATTRIVVIASAVRTPKRSRISPARPCPVTAPSRTAIAW